MVGKVRSREIKQGVLEVVKEVAEVVKEVVEVAKKVIRVVKEVVKEFLASHPKDYDGKGEAIFYTPWIEKIESFQDMSGCGKNQKVKYTSRSFIGKALTWWNSQVQNRGRETAIGITWEEFKVLMREELCPNNEMQNLEAMFWCHTMVGDGHAAYTDRFHGLARLVSYLVNPENKRTEWYIYDLVPQIHEMVVATDPRTLQSAILKAEILNNQAIKNGALKKTIKKTRNDGESSRDANVRMTIRDLGLVGHFPQSLTLLERSTLVRHPNVQTATFIIYPRHRVIRVRT
ncbi:reverse transcriptase domain-containing protein, partial [Tanacetum coccineum]